MEKPVWKDPEPVALNFYTPFAMPLDEVAATYNLPVADVCRIISGMLKDFDYAVANGQEWKERDEWSSHPDIYSILWDLKILYILQSTFPYLDGVIDLQAMEFFGGMRLKAPHPKPLPSSAPLFTMDADF